MAFSLVGSRALVVSRGSRIPPFAAAWWRRVAGSALSAGAVRWRVRGSGRSFSGAVVVAGFSSLAAAGRFAAAWGFWCGVACKVRRRVCSRCGVLWAVSVPVSWVAR